MTSTVHDALVAQVPCLSCPDHRNVTAWHMGHSPLTRRHVVPHCPKCLAQVSKVPPARVTDWYAQRGLDITAFCKEFWQSRGNLRAMRKVRQKHAAMALEVMAMQLREALAKRGFPAGVAKR